MLVGGVAGGLLGVLQQLGVFAAESVEVAGFEFQVELDAVDHFVFEVQVGPQGLGLVAELDNAVFQLGLAADFSAQLSLALVAQAQLLVQIFVLPLEVFQLLFIGRGQLLQALDFRAQFGFVLVAVGQLAGENGVLAMQFLDLRLPFALNGGGRLIAFGQCAGEGLVLAVQFLQFLFVRGLGLELADLSREGLILLAKLGDGLLFDKQLGLQAGRTGLTFQLFLQTSDLLVFLGHQQLGAFVVLLQRQNLGTTWLGPLTAGFDGNGSLATGYGQQTLLALVEQALDAFFFLVVAGQ